MEKRKRLCLVEGRYTCVNDAANISIIEVAAPAHPKKHKRLAALHLDSPVTDHEACLMTLQWLRDQGYISKGEYLTHAAEFLTQASTNPPCICALKPDDLTSPDPSDKKS